MRDRDIADCNLGASISSDFFVLVPFYPSIVDNERLRAMVRRIQNDE
jgi:hypothetical protein